VSKIGAFVACFKRASIPGDFLAQAGANAAPSGTRLMWSAIARGVRGIESNGAPRKKTSKLRE